MANLPSQHPTVSLHLTDATLTPLITSSSSQDQLESLTALANSALISQTAAQRANLGRPQRIMVEYPDRGPVVLHTYLDPREPRFTASAASPSSSPSSKGVGAAAASISKSGPGSPAGAESARPAATAAGSDEPDDSKEAVEDATPSLIGIVVASSAEDSREARRAAGRLERIGREFQREWAAESSRSDPGQSSNS